MLRALACNPSTPHDVLQRLWETHPECVLENPILTLWEFTSAGSLPELIGMRALLALFNRVRGAGEALPRHVFDAWTIVQLARTGADRRDANVFAHLPFEKDFRVRYAMVQHPARRGLFDFFHRHAPDHVWEMFAADPSPEVRLEFANLLRSAMRHAPPARLAIYSSALRILARDDREELQMHLANCRFLPADLVERFSRSPHPGIRSALAAAAFAPIEVRRALAMDADEEVRRSLAKVSEDAGIQALLVGDSSAEVRRFLAENAALTGGVLGLFRHDDAPEVVQAVFLHAKAGTDLRVEILSKTGSGVHEVLLDMVNALTPAFYRRIKSVVSPDVLARLGEANGLRREILEDLACDTRPEVRFAVARRLVKTSHPANREQNAALLNSFAMDADPRIRECVCRDPRLGKQATAFLFSDPDPRVRKKTLCAVLDSLVRCRNTRRAAAYRKTAMEKAALVVTLATDPDHLVRFAIASCHEAPPEALRVLGKDPEAFIRDAVRAHAPRPSGRH